MIDSETTALFDKLLQNLLGPDFYKAMMDEFKSLDEARKEAESERDAYRKAMMRMSDGKIPCHDCDKIKTLDVTG